MKNLCIHIAVLLSLILLPDCLFGQGWTELGTGSNSLNANANIDAMAEDLLGNIYVGGVFTNSAGKNYVAKWDGNTWTEVGAGVNSLGANGSIDAITINILGNIYAAGEFR